MEDPFRLDGEVAIVTGASKGIGFAIAQAFTRAGASVMLCGRNVERGEWAGRELTEAGGAARFMAADVTDEADVAALVAGCTDAFGAPTVLVNNAGPTDLLHARDVDGPLGAIFLDGWERVLRSTLTSAFLMTRQVLAPMIASRQGSIVNISSVAGFLALPGFDAYAAGKAGMDAMTRSVAAGYGHLGIRCNGIRVGDIAVDHSDNRVGREKPTLDPEVARLRDADWQSAKPPPAGHPRDIAHAALYLASPASSYVTGVTLPVDGGLTCRSLLPWATPRPEMLLEEERSTS
jgi:NAD(P)-dependent dehydrogenase (short-subunit alcohol dehydrogenase family)